MLPVATGKFYGLVFSHIRGHLITWDNLLQTWIYADNKTPITIERPCLKCGRTPTVEGYDACLGHLKGVKSACCGHGISEPIMIYSLP